MSCEHEFTWDTQLRNGYCRCNRCMGIFPMGHYIKAIEEKQAKRDRALAEIYRKLQKLMETQSNFEEMIIENVRISATKQKEFEKRIKDLMFQEPEALIPIVEPVEVIPPDLPQIVVETVKETPQKATKRKVRKKSNKSKNKLKIKRK